ncbi:hypothetical protein T492DRAFT_1035615 [Pavlovales sp. CCMP2436]|nr:hypothetical protein T492DRAFT_1035615 [Pavlovales sp. CCMP2436]
MSALVAVYFTVAGGCAVVIFLGPNSDGPLGRAHRGLCGCLVGTRRLCTRLVGAACCKRIERVEEYVCWQPNPLLAGLYVSIMAAFAFAIWQYLFPLVPNERVGWWHRPLSLCIVGGGLLLHQLCCFSDPGVITRENLADFADGYHVYLVCSGTTTNETFKWGDLRAEQSHQRRKRLAERKRTAGPDGEPGPQADGALPHSRGTYPLADAVIQNPYGRSFAQNWGEVLFPPSLRAARARAKSVKSQPPASGASARPTSNGGGDAKPKRL